MPTAYFSVLCKLLYLRRETLAFPIRNGNHIYNPQLTASRLGQVSKVKELLCFDQPPNLTLNLDCSKDGIAPCPYLLPTQAHSLPTVKPLHCLD